jgi:hypothetical protein
MVTCLYSENVDDVLARGIELNPCLSSQFDLRLVDIDNVAAALRGSFCFLAGVKMLRIEESHRIAVRSEVTPNVKTYHKSCNASAYTVPVVQALLLVVLT